MKIRFYLIVICAALMAIIVSCGHNRNKATVSSSTAEETSEISKLPQISYTIFIDNGKFGVKDTNGEILVNASYDNIEIIGNMFYAHKQEETFIFCEQKQIFSESVNFYSVEDKYITAVKGDKDLLYFFDTGLVVEDMNIYYYHDNTFLCQHADNSYAFYSADGKIKAKNLQRISCLQKIKDGYTTKQYLAFRKKNGGRLIYTTTGNLLYDINLSIWQHIAINYLKLDEGDDREYEWTYNYKIDLDRCIQDHLKGAVLIKYPEE